MEIVLILIAAVLPAICLFFFVYRQDKYKKEPLKLLWKGFGFGAIFVAPICIVVELLLDGAFGPASNAWGGIREALFVAAIPEESVKFLFLWLLLRKNKYYDEYFDGVVYAASIGLGFAAAENILYLFEYYDQWVSTGILRALISVPGHFMFAVAMGYFYAKASFDDQTHRKKNLALAICIPILFHAIFDAILFVSDVYGLISLAFIPFFIYLIVKSKRLGKGHLALDKQIMDDIPNDDSLRQA